ncbi:MAG: thioredoxin fold domain-containing protein, partial [Acidobacteriota bacterium]
LQEAVSQGRPVLIDFTARGCVPCRELEHKVFTDRQVVALSAGFTNFKADLTRSPEADLKELMRKYGVVGPPTILFLDRQGTERKDLRVVGFIPPHEFLQRMTALEEKVTLGSQAAPWSAGGS